MQHGIENKLGCASEEEKVVMIEPSIPRLKPKANREKLTQIMFEEFKVTHYYAISDAVCSVMATGESSGMVLHSGGKVTYTVPVLDGYCMDDRSTAKMIELGGEDCTDYMMKILTERGYSWWRRQGIETDIKQKMCYVALDFEKEMGNPKDKEYELPDGMLVTMGNERFRTPEIMFNPDIIGMECDGIHTLLYDSIMHCDVDRRKELWDNVIMTGGNTLFDGFTNRLKKELDSLAPDSMNVNIIATEDRNIIAWKGASMVAHNLDAHDLWISKQDYDEHGPSIIHRKCT